MEALRFLETSINLYRTAPCLIVKDSLLCLHQGNTKTYTLFSDFTLYLGARGGAVGWGTALQAEGCWFDSLWFQCNFSLA